MKKLYFMLKEVVGSLSLEVFKTGPDEAMSNVK